MLAIAFGGASSDEDDFVDAVGVAGEVVDLAGAVVDPDAGSSPAVYVRDVAPPDESADDPDRADGTGAPFEDSIVPGRLIGAVGFVAPGVVSTLAGACLIAKLGLCVWAETGSDDKSDTKLSVKAVMFRLLNCLDLERLFLWFIGPFQAFPKLTPR